MLAGRFGSSTLTLRLLAGVFKHGDELIGSSPLVSTKRHPGVGRGWRQRGGHLRRLRRWQNSCWRGQRAWLRRRQLWRSRGGHVMFGLAGEEAEAACLDEA